MPDAHAPKKPTLEELRPGLNTLRGPGAAVKDWIHRYLTAHYGAEVADKETQHLTDAYLKEKGVTA